jgi:hypothetical protein
MPKQAPQREPHDERDESVRIAARLVMARRKGAYKRVNQRMQPQRRLVILVNGGVLRY